MSFWIVIWIFKPFLLNYYDFGWPCKQKYSHPDCGIGRRSGDASPRRMECHAFHLRFVVREGMHSGSRQGIV